MKRKRTFDLKTKLLVLILVLFFGCNQANQSST